MKKTIITALILVAAISAHSQPKTTKADSAQKKPAKPLYTYSAVIPISDYQSLIQIAQLYQQGVIYSPKLNPDQKVKEQQGIDQFLQGIQSRVKVDSTLVKKP